MRFSHSVLAACVLLGIAVLTLTPPGFTAPRVTTIEQGMTMRGAAEFLDAEGIVLSHTLVRLVSFVRRADTLVKAGSYAFERPIGAWEAVARLARGDFGIETLRVRLAEGSTREQMAIVLADALPRFDPSEFLTLTEGREGYLFPDTYFLSQLATAREVAELLLDTFSTRTETLAGTIALSGRTLGEGVTMAAIVEREAHDPADQRLIAGVLWNRLDIGMALQADATLFYLLGKPSRELTQEDLETDSPFNTYRYPGLPPAPIGNPGLGAIEASLSPTPSDYLYYLSDERGVTHYAETFEEHKENRARYLNQ